MADELRLICRESGRAEDVVGMDVGQHHIADRPVRRGADRVPQALSLDGAAAGIHHHHRLVADDEADIGEPILVGRAGLLRGALMDEEPGRHLHHGERRPAPRGARPCQRKCERCRQPQHNDEMNRNCLAGHLKDGPKSAAGRRGRAARSLGSPRRPG
jgi:hypothetical protein